MALSEFILKITEEYTKGRVAYEVGQILIIARKYDRAIAWVEYRHNKGLISAEVAQLAIQELYRRVDEEMAARNRKNAEL